MHVEVMVPESYMGDVMGDLSSRRGQIKRMEARGGTQVINGARAAVGDVRLRDEPALDDAGPRQLLDAVRRYEEAPQNVSEEVVAKVQEASEVKSRRPSSTN